MSSLFPKVIQIIKKNPEERTEAEIKALTPWFKKKNKLLEDLNADVLSDLIKNCKHTIKKRDDIVIQQGEKGHNFYIILRGQVSVYHKESLDDGTSSSSGMTISGDGDRSKMGNFLVRLADGSGFGEIALISEDCIRTASIVSDEQTDLLTIDRALYNRSVKNAIQKDFEERLRFVDTSHMFNDWNNKMKKHLAMSIARQVITFGDVVFKQGEEADTLYFITNGEVKVSVDAVDHLLKFSKIITAFETYKNGDSIKSNDDLDLLSSRNHQNHNKLRRNSSKHQKSSINIAFLGQNQLLGDAEVLLNLPTYYSTCTCTQETSVMTLKRTHYDRLFRRKNQQTVQYMVEALETQTATRLQTKTIQQNIPFLMAMLFGLYELFYDKKYKMKITFQEHFNCMITQLFPQAISNGGTFIREPTCFTKRSKYIDL